MARHRLDLLPLLDVFMVVLFVFATIQEQRLDDTTRDAERLQQRIAEAERVLRSAEARSRQREAEHDEAAQQQADALAQAKREAQHLRRELEELRQDFVEQKARTRRELAQAGVPEQMLARVDVLERVLDKYSVFEIELGGGIGEAGEVITRCCYRTDPLLDQWHSCGVVPARPEDRAAWLDEGAGGLVDALRRTKGGNSMTLVRQHDQEGGFRMASRLAEQLRERFSDQHVYAETEPDLVLHCTD